MVVTGSIQRAIQYFHAIEAYLKQRKSPHRAIVAFSDTEIDGEKVTEASVNGFPSSQIETKIQEDPYRFLVAADKFQTGYDEPLLHTMYVDKQLSGVRAVQTLSRLNRAHPAKHDTFVLDFVNDADTIRAAFEPYYRTTILAEETDPNKLHDLQADLDGHQVYTAQDVDILAELYLSGAERDQLDPILDASVALYNDLDEDHQVDFKGKAKAFVRTYEFLASVLPYSNAGWEKLSIYLRFLVPKLPTPPDEDLSKGILESIDMESYRAEAQATMQIALADQDAEIDPVPVSGGGARPEPEIDVLSSIIRAFNDQFGNIEWKDADKIRKVITEELPELVSADTAYQNAIANSDRQNARIEHDKVLQRVITQMVMDQTELFKQFNDNQSFKKWLSDTIFQVTYRSQLSAEPETTSFPILEAESLIHAQFGTDEKWSHINQTIWQFFEAQEHERLGLSAIKQIAAETKTSPDDVLAVVSLLTGPDEEFLRRVYYRRDANRMEEVPANEVTSRMHSWWLERTFTDQEWEEWASEVMVGWEPTVGIELRTHTGR